MSTILTHVSVLLGVMLTLVFVYVLLRSRRTPQSIMAWLLFLVVAPYLALPVFLLLGIRKSGATMKQPRFNADGPDTAVPREAQPFRGFDLPPPTGGHDFVLHETAEAARRDLFDLIDAARERLDLCFYLLDDDASGNAVIEALTARQEAGITVRLTLDRLGTLRPPTAALRRFQDAGGRLRYYSPLLRKPFTERINLRNHRKVAIADGRVVWSGGRNLGDAYLSAAGNRRWPIWRDLSFRVTGPVVESYCTLFNSDWAMSTGGGGPADLRAAPAPTPGDDSVVQLVPSGPEFTHDLLHDGLTGALHRARRRAVIVTPYFIPTEPLAIALICAARRGVDVRLILPEKSNQWTTDLARGVYVRALAREGVTVLRFQPGMVHAKTGVIDDIAWVGTANFDIRSMQLNFETALFVFDAPTAQSIADWCEALESDCIKGPKKSGILRRSCESLLRLGAPLL